MGVPPNTCNNKNKNYYGCFQWFNLLKQRSQTLFVPALPHKKKNYDNSCYSYNYCNCNYWNSCCCNYSGCSFLIPFWCVSWTWSDCAHTHTHTHTQKHIIVEAHSRKHTNIQGNYDITGWQSACINGYTFHTTISTSVLWAHYSEPRKQDGGSNQSVSVCIAISSLGSKCI